MLSSNHGVLSVSRYMPKPTPRPTTAPITGSKTGNKVPTLAPMNVPAVIEAHTEPPDTAISASASGIILSVALLLIL